MRLGRNIRIGQKNQEYLKIDKTDHYEYLKTKPNTLRFVDNVVQLSMVKCHTF